jgi:hypothetical protein
MTDQLASEGYDPRKAFANKKDGEVYYLKLVTRPDATGEASTVFCLKNEVHFWEGTEEQFKECFEV